MGRPCAQWREFLRLLPLARWALDVGGQPGAGVYAAIRVKRWGAGAGRAGLLKRQRQAALKQALQVEFEKRSFAELCELFAGV